MKPMYKITFIFVILLIVSEAYAQSLPDISYRDYGFSKLVKQVEQIYYSIDGDSVEKVEKVTRKFNADGNIESYKNQSFLDGTWAKSECAYKKGRLHQEVWTHSNPYLNHTYIYVYDKQGKMTEEKIRFKGGSKSHIKFRYKDSLLTEIEADMDGTQFVTERYYSAKGKLYKEIYRQKVPDQADIVTHYHYLEDKEITSYVAPQSYFYATAYLKDKMGFGAGEIKFKLIEDSTVQDKLLKGILRFEQEALQDNLPFDLQAYSEQTLQAYEKNKDKLIPYRMVLCLRDENNNITAEAEVDLKTKNITGIGFFKTEFADGTTTGTTDFRHKKMHLFEAMFQHTDLP